MRLVHTAALGSALLLASPAFAQDLDLDAGTMQLGGTAAFAFDVQMPDGADGVSGSRLSIGPTFGYFVLDNLLLSVDLTARLYFGDLYEPQDFGLGPVDFFGDEIGFSLGGRYYLPLSELIVAYGGVRLGMGFTLADGIDTQKTLFFVVPAGILIPLNTQLAIDAGLRVRYDLSLNDGGTDGLSIPVGYFGIQAFF